MYRQHESSTLNMRGTVPPTAGARSTLNTWWRALGHSHHASALVVCQAVFLFDAAPVAEVYHLVYGVCTPQAVIEVLEALVERGS